jgi:hypothetical protein
MWSFNGFRFNLTTHVFVYGLLQYFFEKKKKGLIWCFLSPFVFHYAFILPAALLGLYLVFRDRVTIYFGMFIFSLFFAEFDSAQFNKLVETYAPASFEEKSESYRKDSSFEKLEETASTGVLGGKQSWHAALYKKSIFWSMYVFLIYFYFRRKKLMELHPNFLSILSFVLLFFSVANIMMNVPSGTRYSVVASLFALSFITIYIQNATFDNLGARISKWLSPVLLFYIIVSARTGFFYLSLTTIVGNPIIAIFTIGENINLDLLLK